MRRFTSMPEDQFHLNLIWILLRFWVKFVLGGLSFIAGVVAGAVLFEFYRIPFWVPIPILILCIGTRKLYPILLMLGVLLGLLGGVIH
jgi:uncharacterized membrane protein YoaK (UPF0700 family)